MKTEATAEVPGSRGCQTAAAAPPPPELVDELDLKGVPDELVMDWAAREAKYLERMESNGRKAGARPLRPEVRQAALHFLKGLVDLSSLPHSSWFDAVLLLDFCYLSGRVTEEALPMVCAVLVSLLKKNDTATVVAPLADLAQPTTAFARWMSGTDSKKVTQQDLRLQEAQVLTALDWQLNWPSVQTWMMALCDRLDVLLRHLVTQSLEWIYTQSMTGAATLLTHHSASASMSPQRMANGLLCVYLVVGRMVPLAALRPPHLSETEWQDLFCKSQCTSTPPTCLMPPARAAGVLGVLLPVTGCEFKTLRVDTLAVVEAMLAVVQKASQSSDGGAGWPNPCHQEQPAVPAVPEPHRRPRQLQQQDPERGQRLVAVC